MHLLNPLIKLSFFTLSLLLVCFFLWLGLYLLPYIMPLLVVLTFAVLIEPVNEFLMKWKGISRAIAVAISNTLFLTFVFGLIALGGTKVVVELIVLFQKLPNLLNSMGNDTVALFEQIRGVYQELPPEFIERINNALNSLIDSSQTLVTKLVSWLFGLISALPGIFIVGLIMTVSFVLISYRLPLLKEKFLNLFSEQAQIKVNRILNDLNSAIIGFVRAQIILSLLTYIITVIGLMILRIDYVLAIALIITLVDILPILGTGSVIIPWSIYLFYNGDNITAVGLIILYLIMTIIRRIIEPKILGSHIGLSSLATIISLYLGIAILGGWGIFLGPILFIIIQSMRRTGLLNFKFHF